MAHGIFCLEGDWWGTPHKRATVEPMLTLLRSAEGWEIPYKHRDVATRSEFEHHLKKWQQGNHNGFPILYLAFHGEQGRLIVGADERAPGAKIDLDELEKLIDVRGQNRMIFFGSCSTLSLHGRRINRFLERTGIQAVCGYSDDVDWMDATIFDLMLLSHLSLLPTMTAKRILNEYEKVREKLASLAKGLSFRIEAHPSVLDG
jgi:hypothetical protein